jgi:hypothetical protein
MMTSDISTISKLEEYNNIDGTSADLAEQNGDNLTPSQRRMKALIERHEAVLAFNEKLEKALKNGDNAIIDECIEHSRKNDYMAQHRSYMAELTKDLANQVGN